jgi:hypothetical protein
MFTLSNILASVLAAFILSGLVGCIYWLLTKVTKLKK